MDDWEKYFYLNKLIAKYKNNWGNDKGKDFALLFAHSAFKKVGLALFPKLFVVKQFMLLHELQNQISILFMEVNSMFFAIIVKISAREFKRFAKNPCTNIDA